LLSIGALKQQELEATTAQEIFTDGFIEIKGPLM